MLVSVLCLIHNIFLPSSYSLLQPIRYSCSKVSRNAAHKIIRLFEKVFASKFHTMKKIALIVIWWQRSGSTLASVMACCLMAPIHYLNQCWLIIKVFCGIHLWAILQEKVFMTLFCYMHLEIILLKLLPYLPGTNELNSVCLVTINLCACFD